MLAYYTGFSAQVLVVANAGVSYGAAGDGGGVLGTGGEVDVLVGHLDNLVVFQGQLVEVSRDLGFLHVIDLGALDLVDEGVGEGELVESDQSVVLGLAL